MQKNDASSFFERSYPIYDIQNYEWKVLSNEEMESVRKKKMADNHKIGEIFILQEMWNLHLIERAEVAFLIEPKYIKDKMGEELYNWLKICEKLENVYDENSIVKIYFSYPFSYFIELIIFPATMTTFYDSIKTSKTLPIGFIAWQVSKLFVILFRKEYKDDEIGNILGALQLTSFTVFQNNIFSLDIST